MKRYLMIFAVFLTFLADAITRDLNAQEDYNRLAEPVLKEIEGWQVKVDPLLLGEQKETGERSLKALANHLQRIDMILPKNKVDALRKLPIWIEFKNERLKSMQYHPSKGWLLSNRHDPRLAKHVHVPIASALYEQKTWAKHPYVVLHELAHAYHDQVLGFGHAKIASAFEEAKSRGIYDEVLSIHGGKVRHYGMNNAKEFFAEATEAYLGVNDFYPFVRAELKEHDPRMFGVLEEVWGRIR